jgi:hypothetical protein
MYTVSTDDWYWNDSLDMLSTDVWYWNDLVCYPLMTDIRLFSTDDWNSLDLLCMLSTDDRYCIDLLCMLSTDDWFWIDLLGMLSTDDWFWNDLLGILGAWSSCTHDPFRHHCKGNIRKYSNKWQKVKIRPLIHDRCLKHGCYYPSPFTLHLFCFHLELSFLQSVLYQLMGDLSTKNPTKITQFLTKFINTLFQIFDNARVLICLKWRRVFGI